MEHPRLSWTLHSNRRGMMQSAYRLLVASSPEILASRKGDLWDSGKVVSSRSIQVEYGGKPLTSGQRCYWAVRVWDEKGEATNWSPTSYWSMGLLTPSDWKARWIGYDAAYDRSLTSPTDIRVDDKSRETGEKGGEQEDALHNLRGLKWVRYPLKQTKPGTTTLLRTVVNLPAERKVTRARLVLYADNIATAFINGQKIGQAVRWDKTARLDATYRLHSGANTLILHITQNDLLPPSVIGKLVISFDAGENLTVPIDRQWHSIQALPRDIDPRWDLPDFDLPNFDPGVAGGWMAAEAFDGTPWRGPAPVADVERMPVPYLRKKFNVSRPIKRATVYVTALGTYELHLNGAKVGNDVLTPGWTEFRKRVLYQTYDVTRMIHQGDNAIGALLGDGWYASVLAHLGKRQYYGGKPRLLAQLDLELVDGTHQLIVTDDSWRASYGPLLHADLLIGCEYDSRRPLTGWDRPTYNDRSWKPVVLDTPLSPPASGGKDSISHTSASGGKDGVSRTSASEGKDGISHTSANAKNKTALREKAPVNEEKPLVQAAVAEPSRPLEMLPTTKVTEPAPGCWTFDLGQNMVGWVRLKVKGDAGQRITVRYGEMLNPDGTLYTANLRSCPATDFFILSGAQEVLEPTFTFHGFRYVEIRGLTGKPTPDMVTGVVVHTPMERTGTFSCSDPLLNRLYANIIWGQKGNYLEVPTDCPQRDERMGWTGDTQFFVPTAAYNYNIAPFFTRWLQICRDDQYPDGTFPHVVPDIMGGGGATAWGDAALLCAYQIYRVYGDTRLVATHFSAMERYMRWLDTKTQNGITNVGGFGDWLNLGGGAESRAIDTAYHIYLARIMAEMAQAIGRKTEANDYIQIHDRCKEAFQAAYLQPDGTLKGCSQTGYALAFTMDLLPEDTEVRKAVANKYVEEIHRFNDHLATGFIGTPRLLPGLDLAGRNDIAYKLLLTKTYPSWLYQVTLGATTMWERWNAWTPEGGFGDVSMNSFNHYAFGSVGEYLYSTVGGIRPGSPGYKTIIIRPAIEPGLTWAKSSFLSPHGPIATSWRRQGHRLSLEVTIPANTTARIYVPSSATEPITESGKPLRSGGGTFGLRTGEAHIVRREEGHAVVTVGSGTYIFVSTLPSS